MDDTKQAESALRQLAQQGSTARTLMGRFRELMPAIEAAQTSGVTHESILQTLNENGWELKMVTYQTMLYRLRNKKVKKYATASEVVPAVPAIEPTPKKEAEQKQAPPVKSAQSAPGNEGEGKQESPTPPKPGQIPKFDWDLDTNVKPEW